MEKILHVVQQTVFFYLYGVFQKDMPIPISWAFKNERYEMVSWVNSFMDDTFFATNREIKLQEFLDKILKGRGGKGLSIVRRHNLCSSAS